MKNLAFLLVISCFLPNAFSQHEVEVIGGTPTPLLVKKWMRNYTNDVAFVLTHNHLEMNQGTTFLEESKSLGIFGPITFGFAFNDPLAPSMKNVNVIQSKNFYKNLDVLSILPSGRVGVGTDTPRHTFHVNSESDQFSGMFETGTPHSIIRLISSHDHSTGVEFLNRDGKAAIWVDGAKTLDGHRGGNDALTILQNGNVGLGLADDPLHNLHVAENIRSEGLLIGTDELVPNTVLTIDGAVYISSDDDDPATADDKEYGIAKKYLTDYSLWVQDGIVTDDIAIVSPELWSDYVFEEDYPLLDLSSLEEFIQKNKHLPNIPSERLIKKDGYTLHKMNTLLLEKVEELTLYTIEQEKKIQAQRAELDRLNELEERLKNLEDQLSD